MSEDRTFLLFDFDGVIADTFHIAHRVAQKVCVFYTEAEYKKSFEGNVHDYHSRLQDADHGDRCDHTLDWWAEFTPGFNTHAKPFDGMPELLGEFAEKYTLCIVSSGHDALITGFLEKYGLTKAIAGVYGSEVHTRKDEKFKMIYSQYDTTPTDCLFVTDTLGDINEATTVGLSSVGVTWGFQDRETLARGNPFAIAELPLQLPTFVDAYFQESTMK
ncbi:MAG: HAD hydrolase-like protein [Candidatus Pacebacteria bacterium]|nr:HAD hydrolase-like protein [Candidatus Paceibacterota bacterium]